jgi:uncharacterized membrane protein (DUF2068 family)
VTHQLAPGAAGRPRKRPRVHYELLACAFEGHHLVGVGAARVRPQDHPLVREIDGHRWHRCLRCDAWVVLALPATPTMEVAPSIEEIEVPLRGRALRDKFVLRLIALDRAFHFVVLALLAVALFVVAAHQSQLRGSFYRILSDLQGPVAASTQNPQGLVKRLRDVLSLRAGTLQAVAFVAAGYAVLEGVEAVGLWYGRRWAEYLTFIATTALLPLEIYELSNRVSVFKVGAFLVNVVVVVYLLLAKRLFGLRGGAEADRLERERDGGWPAVQRATPPLAGVKGSEA